MQAAQSVDGQVHNVQWAVSDVGSFVRALRYTADSWGCPRQQHGAYIQSALHIAEASEFTGSARHGLWASRQVSLMALMQKP